MYDIQDFYERSKALLATQFQESKDNGEKTNLQKLIAALVVPAQDINDTLLQLQNLRWLATAQGVQLDGIGQILGLARQVGQSDADYRELLYFQVRINSSNGTPEEIIDAIKFLTKANTIQYLEPHPAFYQLFTDGLPANFSIPPGELVVAMNEISPAGVASVPITCSFGLSPIFSFSTDPIVEDFYVAPNPDDLAQVNPFHVSPDGILDDQFQINRGQTEGDGEGWFAELDYDQPGAGFFAEVLVLNGNIPLP